ncbi:MAG: hypothetical protein LBT95_00410, partial [Treponema sp.]|nr:hypothetical protein [Treponema sp.]
MKKLVVFRVGIFLRMLLFCFLCFLAYFIPPGGLFSFAAAVRNQKISERINGMGGAAYPETSIAAEVLNAELAGMGPAISGIPEPDEYSRPKMLLHTLYKVR